MQLEEFDAQLSALSQEAQEALAQTQRKEDAIVVKNGYLGRKGKMQQVMQILRELPNDQKREAGQISNTHKQAIEQAFLSRMQVLEAQELERQLAAQTLDVTLPSRPVVACGEHPLERVRRELEEVFERLGFDVAEGPEMEEDFYNFESLNFPPDHPARDMQDTFGLKDGRLLRTHTSPVQVRTMLAYDAPVKVISPGRVYRVDNDITHSPVFHQVEGLFVDRDVTFADLKGTLEHFAKTYFGPDTAVRFRPSYFPFTEPSAEMDIGCIFCAQEGCRVCSQTGWLEILGSGMVDPNVLTNVGIDPEEYSGFAFGMGVERIAMLKFGVADIRLFFENDLRFLNQFDFERGIDTHDV